MRPPRSRAAGPTRAGRWSLATRTYDGLGAARLFALEFTGRGMGRLLVPLVVRRQATRRGDLYMLDDAGTATSCAAQGRITAIRPAPPPSRRRRHTRVRRRGGPHGQPPLGVALPIEGAVRVAPQPVGGDVTCLPPPGRRLADVAEAAPTGSVHHQDALHQVRLILDLPRTPRLRPASDKPAPTPTASRQGVLWAGRGGSTLPRRRRGMRT